MDVARLLFSGSKSEMMRVSTVQGDDMNISFVFVRDFLRSVVVEIEEVP